MYDDMSWHEDYRGGLTPVRDGLRVCQNCRDQPQPFFQLQVLGPDPIPLQNPRPDDNGEQPGLLELEDQGGFVELQNQLGVIELDQLNYPQYETGALPDPAAFSAGFQIDVLGLGTPVRAYADTINWRRVDTNAVIS